MKLLEHRDIGLSLPATFDPALSTVALPLDVLGARICGLAKRTAQATYHWLAMIAEFDRRGGWAGVGIKSCAHWLAWTCSMAPGTAREHVRVARSIVDLPLVSAEMAAGRLSFAKVREITRVSDRLDETKLVNLARIATASQFARAVGAFESHPDNRLAQENSRKARYFTDDDGSVVITARLPAEEGAVVIAALEAARDELRRQENELAESNNQEGRGSQDGTELAIPISTPDMLLHWARGYLASTPEDRSGEDRTTVVVHVGAQQLLDAERVNEKRSRGNVEPDNIPTDSCMIPTVGGISAHTAARLACDARIVGIIRDIDGAVLAHGRSRRVVSAAQRRALTIRDGYCQFPSCDRTSHLEAHHIRHWAHGGTTDPENLILLCRFHHMTCHDGGISIHHNQNSTETTPSPKWRFINRDGQQITPDDLLGNAAGRERDRWLLWYGLDGTKGWNDPEAQQIRPTWAGEPAILAELVDVLFRARKNQRPVVASADPVASVAA